MTDHQATLAHPESFSRTRKVTTSLPPFTLPALDIPSTRNPYRAFGDHNRQRWTTTAPKAAGLTSPSPYPPPLTHSIPQPSIASQSTTSTTTTPSNSNLTTTSGSEITAEGLNLSSGINSSGSQSSQQPGSSLYYSTQLTGSWPTPGSSSQSAYTYLSPDSNPGSGSLTQTSYTHRPQATFGSVPSSVTNYSGSRTTTTSTTAETVPVSSSYQDQHSFPTSVGSGGPLGSSHPSQASNPTQPMLSSQNPAVTQPPTAGHGSSLPSLQDFGNFRTSSSQSSYYPSGTQQPQSSTPSSYYPSPSTPQQGTYPGFQGAPPSQLSPTGYSPSTTQGNASRGVGSISSSGSSTSGLQYVTGSRPQQYGLQSHHHYSLNGHGHGPVLSNIHQPGTPLAMVGMSGMHYGAHHPMPQYHRYGAGHDQLGPRPGDRPYKCDQCTQGFNRNHDLKRHKRIHLATKPYPCGNCEKSFSRKDALKVGFLAMTNFIATTSEMANIPFASCPASQTCQGLRKERSGQRKQQHQGGGNDDRRRVGAGQQHTAIGRLFGGFQDFADGTHRRECERRRSSVTTRGVKEKGPFRIGYTFFFSLF